eukprot:CAMPEP_0182927092 /NCGR_PEP_ID=MMETSP0105_2-20130417/13148_1 /TAXON_ID=81532 ORGANISM="Acanthoeca-like sp., Strain 10tr" /NCGR_SAMPLE_ID=MMETSP0105_2 /ASSEMBLY_ACC=CAM_ASM_000205 /LENGTH=857 /DNA_ID=CAMNT_0025065019 /DNA_START=32 /DNA_END=2605 /DNA_ORIENTATION=+
MAAAVNRPPRHGRVLLGTLDHPLDRGFPHRSEVKEKWRKEVVDLRVLVRKYAEQYKIKAFFTLVGHGSANQIESMADFEASVRPLIDSLNGEYGKWNWAVVYGGDPASDAKPDIGCIAKLFDQLGARVVAVQCSEYAEYMIPSEQDGSHRDRPRSLLVDSYGFLDTAIFYKTEKKKDGSILFGGFDTTNPLHHVVGTTRYVLELFGSSAHGKSPRDQLLKGEIICGGGPISVHEHQEFFRRGYPSYYLPTPARFVVVDSDLRPGESLVNKYGIMHAWYSDVGIPPRMWVALDQGVVNGKDQNVVDWVVQEKQKSVKMEIDTDEHDKFKLPKFVVTKLRENGGEAPHNEPPIRVVLPQESVQKEIHVAFKIKRIYEINEKENVVGLNFDFTAMVESPVLTQEEQSELELEQEGTVGEQLTNHLLTDLLTAMRGGTSRKAMSAKKASEGEQFGWGDGAPAPDEANTDQAKPPGSSPLPRRKSVRKVAVSVGSAGEEIAQQEKGTLVIPELEFSNAVNVSIKGGENWNSETVEQNFKYVEQQDPCGGQKRAFRIFHVEVDGEFMTMLDLDSFPFDTQLIQIKLSTMSYACDIEKYRIVPLKQPAAVMLGSAGQSIPNWSLLTYKGAVSGCSKFDPWCGATMEYTTSDPSSGLSYRSVTCTFAVNRVPDSVVYNIGVPTFVLTLGQLLIFTIPVSEGDVKDERVNIAFVVFLSFIALKIVVMDMLPPLPYATFIEEYILGAITYVALVAGHNALMLWAPGIKDNEEKIKEADRWSLVASLSLWCILHVWVFFKHRGIKKALGKFLSDNNLVVQDDEQIFKHLLQEKTKAVKKRKTTFALTKRVNLNERFPRKVMARDFEVE